MFFSPQILEGDFWWCCVAHNLKSLGGWGWGLCSSWYTNLAREHPPFWYGILVGISLPTWWDLEISRGLSTGISTKKCGKHVEEQFTAILFLSDIYVWKPRNKTIVLWWTCAKWENSRSSRSECSPSLQPGIGIGGVHGRTWGCRGNLAPHDAASFSHSTFIASKL